MTRAYRLSILFGATSIVVIAVAAVVAIRVIGGTTEDHPVRIAEENTERDAVHIPVYAQRPAPVAVNNLREEEAAVISDWAGGSPRRKIDGVGGGLRRRLDPGAKTPGRKDCSEEVNVIRKYSWSPG